MTTNTRYFDCQCSQFNHVIRFSHDLTDNTIQLETNINHYLPWYKRVWEAFRFVFKMNRAYGHYDVTSLRPQDMDSLALMFEDYFSYDKPMTKEEAQDLLDFAKSYPNFKDIISGAWICNLQGTNYWVIDSMTVSGHFIRIKNDLNLVAK